MRLGISARQFAREYRPTISSPRDCSSCITRKPRTSGVSISLWSDTPDRMNRRCGKTRVPSTTVLLAKVAKRTRPSCRHGRWMTSIRMTISSSAPCLLRRAGRIAGMRLVDRTRGPPPEDPQHRHHEGDRQETHVETLGREHPSLNVPSAPCRHPRRVRRSRQHLPQGLRCTQ
jgi:hypothetical protein